MYTFCLNSPKEGFGGRPSKEQKMVHAISYDLHQPGRNYEALARAIMGISGSYCRPLQSLWFVETQMTSTQVRDYLLPHLDSNDSLVVTRIIDVAWHNIASNQVGWLTGSRNW
jgi:hypothetical protein